MLTTVYTHGGGLPGQIMPIRICLHLTRKPRSIIVKRGESDYHKALSSHCLKGPKGIPTKE